MYDAWLVLISSGENPLKIHSCKKGKPFTDQTDSGGRGFTCKALRVEMESKANILVEALILRCKMYMCKMYMCRASILHFCWPCQSLWSPAIGLGGGMAGDQTVIDRTSRYGELRAEEALHIQRITASTEMLTLNCLAAGFPLSRLSA